MSKDRTNYGRVGFQVGIAGSNVSLEFSQPISWVALPPEAAKAMAKSLLDAVQVAERTPAPEPTASPIVLTDDPDEEKPKIH